MGEESESRQLGCYGYEGITADHTQDTKIALSVRTFMRGKNTLSTLTQAHADIHTHTHTHTYTHTHTHIHIHIHTQTHDMHTYALYTCEIYQHLLNISIVCRCR